MSKTYIISDTHFLHKNLIKYTNRPKNFNKIIIQNWNNLVKPEDTIIHLGDVSCGLKEYSNGEELLHKIFEKLNGTKHLIKGNHDYKPNQYYLDLGFDTVQDYIINGDILLCHYPLDFTEKYDKEFINIKKELLKVFEENNCKEIYHGHSHQKHFTNNKIKHTNFAVELNNYSPVEVH